MEGTEGLAAVHVLPQVEAQHGLLFYVTYRLFGLQVVVIPK